MLEVSGGASVFGENSGSVTIFVGVDEVNSFLQGIFSYYTNGGTENFFLVTGHVFGYVIDQSGTNE